MPCHDAYFDEMIAIYPVLTALRSQVRVALNMLKDCARSGGVIYTCGNGGSAADAEHIVGELMKGFLLPRPMSVEDRQSLIGADAELGPIMADKLQRGIRAVSLVSGIALSSAFSNDVLPELTFAQQIYALGRPGDVLWGISTSGNSRNVIFALAAAKARGVKTLGLTGGNGGRMAELCDIELRIPAWQTPKIQELHLPVYHALCAALEAELYYKES